MKKQSLGVQFKAEDEHQGSGSRVWIDRVEATSPFRQVLQEGYEVVTVGVIGVSGWSSADVISMLLNSSGPMSLTFGTATTQSRQGSYNKP